MFARPGPMWSEQALSGATREPFVPTGLWRIWGGVVFRSTWTEWPEDALAEAGLKPGTCMTLGGFQV